jgi:hypothetical protein
MKNKKQNATIVFGTLLLEALIYGYSSFICDGVKCYSLEVDVLEPLFYGLLGFLFSTSYLLMFSRTIFASWTRHIMSWFFLVAFVSVLSIDKNGWGVLSLDPVLELSQFLAIALSLVTLIYAPVMHYRLKKRGGL